MITLKSAHEIELMRRAGKITAAARALAREMVKPGVTTHQIDKAVFDFIRSHGATPSFLHYNGYPASVCVSVNDEIIHGIPGPRVLQEGDVVSVDVGAYIGGVHGDCAGTYPCGKVSDEDMDLIRVTQESFFQGLKYAREGYRLSDISAAVQQYAESHGYSIVREYVGHGIGHHMHEPPEVPNFGKPGHGPRLLRGMTIAVEPMVNAGAGRLDGENCGRQEGGPLREHHPDHRRRPGASDGRQRVFGVKFMDIAISNIVRSTAGRDKGDLFFVLATEGDFLLLADGKRRRVEDPKRKRRKHTELCGESHSPVAEKIRSGEKITNSELRKALAAFSGGNQDQEG